MKWFTTNPSGSGGSSAIRDLQWLGLTPRVRRACSRCYSPHPDAYSTTSAAVPDTAAIELAELVSRSCWRDLDPVDLGVVLDGDELDGERPGAAGGGGERLGDRLVLAVGGGEDVEVGQYLRPVDEDAGGSR